MSIFHAADADQHGVSNIRERFFGRPLAEEEARALLDSPAVRFLSRQQFADLGIPIHKHQSVLISEAESDFAPYTQDEFWAEVGAAAQEFRIPFAGKEPPALYAPASHWAKPLRIEWAGGIVERTFELPEALRPENGEPLEVPRDAQFPFRLRPWDMWPQSVLASMITSAENLMREYPWTDLRDVLWFILTGQPPFIYPVMPGASMSARQHYSRGTLTLEIEPWVPVKVVAALYVANQQRMLDGKNRRIQDRALKVFRFVLDATRTHGKRPPWKELREQWNSRYPAEPFNTDSHFLGEYNRVEKALIHPEYRFPSQMGLTTINASGERKGAPK